MKLLTLGINHKTAPLEIREQAVFTPENTSAALRELLQSNAVNEAVILSTCNRTELYSDGHDANQLVAWLAKRQLLDENSLNPYLYCYEGAEAVRHIMRVACGLDSMVLGEPQILGQLKSAVTLAKESGAIGNYLHRLFQSVFAVGKEIRTQTGIGANPVSVAHAVLTLARQIFANVPKSTILLIGAGETIELVATHFHSRGLQNLIIANRSHEKACRLAQKFNAKGVALTELNAHLAQADIVITATTSALPILGKGAVESALKLRKHRPMLMIDLAVPRDIETEVTMLEDVYLYHLDDLQTIIAENLKSREAAAKHAETLIETKVTHFMRELYALEFVDIIRAYRENIEKISAKEIAQGLKELQQGKSPEQALKNVTHSLVQKILHQPTVQMRKAAYDGEVELLLLARRLFDI